DHQIGSLADEGAIVANAFHCAEIEIDAGMDAALPKVSIERAVIAMLLEKLAQISQIISDFVRRTAGASPPSPCTRSSWTEGRSAGAGFAISQTSFSCFLSS